MLTMLVRDAMTPRPVTIDAEAPVETAVATMRERRLRHLPVVDDDGRLVGIVTDRDLRSTLLGPAIADYVPSCEGRLRRMAEGLNETRVGHVMTWGVVTIGPEAPLGQAAAVMADARVGSLPVVEQGRLIGIVTERDVVKALAATLPSIRGDDPDSYFW
jgi:acetoin utilization protein AcuB